MTVHWGSFWLGIGVMFGAELIFFSVYIWIAERRLKKILDDEKKGDG